MVQLVANGDNEVLSNSKFIKNAVFYKDMLAFYDAYRNLLSLKGEDIPNYCKLTGDKLCLEGICLFMKSYASELGFESTKLSLGYLKVIYYTIASMSSGKDLPERSVIEKEFKAYQDASGNVLEKAKDEMLAEEKNYTSSRIKFENDNNKYAHKLVLSRIFDGLFIALIVIGVISAMLVFSFYFLNKITLLTSILVSVSLLVVFVAAASILKIISKKSGNSSSDLAYMLQNLKKNKDADLERYNSAKDNYNRVLLERYEFTHKFTLELQKLGKPLSFKEVAGVAKKYHLLSYNIKLDVLSLFDSFEDDIAGVLSSIKAKSDGSEIDKLTQIYMSIDGKDWLKYNMGVRIEFLKRFIGQAKRSFIWKMDIGGKKVDPFNIDVKKLAKQQVAYLKSADDLFVSAPLDKLLSTNFIKNQKILDIASNASGEHIREIASSYLQRFYNLDNLRQYNNLFYNDNLSGERKVPEKIKQENAMLPALIWLKVKCLQGRAKLGNADSRTILELQNLVNCYEGGTLYEMEGLNVVVADEDALTNIATNYAEDLENYGVKYTYGETQFIGYRLA